jgi:uncharacterized membrane protein YqaE (UPF0057 family)
MWNSYDKLRCRVQCSVIEASLGRYATHQYITYITLYSIFLCRGKCTYNIYIYIVLTITGYYVSKIIVVYTLPCVNVNTYRRFNVRHNTVHIIMYDVYWVHDMY